MEEKMTKTRPSKALRVDEVEQLHGELIQYIQQRLAFLVEDYGFRFHPISPFNRKEGGGASLVTFAKDCTDTELWIRIQMEYTVIWGVILWDIHEGSCKAAGIHRIISKRCPRQTFKPTTSDLKEAGREYIDYLGCRLKSHFEDLLQGDLSILSNKKRRN